MSPVQILPLPAFATHQTSPWSMPDNINSAPFCMQPVCTNRAAPDTGDNAYEQPFFLFKDLPPLLHGHSDVHMRQGVLNALHAATAGEPDAEQPFLVADLGYIYQQNLRWKRCLPGIEPFYAVKCNPDPYVLRLLAALGIGFDCASTNEITNILNIGHTTVDPSRIIFANPCKAASSIYSAMRAKVDLMTFDNIDELYKIARIHRSAKLVLRILVEDAKARFPLGLKFGAPLLMVPALLSKAKELSLDVIGVSFHVGSGCSDPDTFANAVRRARMAFDMGDKAGYTFSLLDVGGGFEGSSFEETASILMHALDEFFPNRIGADVAGTTRGKDVRVIAEPGRFYVSEAFRLAVNIIARRAPMDGGRDNDKNEHHQELRKAEDDMLRDNVDPQHMMYYINDGIYGVLNCVLFDPGTARPYVLMMDGSFDISAMGPLQKCCVWGPTCDSQDCVFPTALLPQAMCVGDWLGFDNMGAYTLSVAGHFNGFGVSNIIYTLGDKHAADVCTALTEFAASTTTIPASDDAGQRV